MWNAIDPDQLVAIGKSKNDTVVADRSGLTPGQRRLEEMSLGQFEPNQLAIDPRCGPVPFVALGSHATGVFGHAANGRAVIVHIEHDTAECSRFEFGQ